MKINSDSRKLRIALINPKLEGPCPPLGIGYLASYLKKFGRNDYLIKIFDGNCCRNILQEVQRFEPNIVGFTALSNQIKEANNLSLQIRAFSKGTLQIIGGLHVSALSEDTLSEGSFDIGVLGEGEDTFRELVDAHALKNFSANSLKAIKGICFKDDGLFIRTEEREEIANLDSIPPPDRELFDMEHYLSFDFFMRGYGGNRVATIMGSRGCPFDCLFCSSKIIFKKTRQFSPDYIVNEIRELVNRYKINFVFFTDDTFTVNKERIKKICDLLIGEGLNKKIRWDIHGRADMIDWDDLALLQLMKRAGCIQIDYGFESGSEKVLNILKKGKVTLEDNLRAIAVTKKSGLQVFGTFMLGVPGEDENDLMETKNFILNNFSNIDYYQTFISTPYPGTQLYDLCLEKNLLPNEYLKQLDSEGKATNRILVYSDTVSHSKTVETLRFLNKEAQKKIKFRNKVRWLVSNILKRPMIIKDTIKFYYFKK